MKRIFSVPDMSCNHCKNRIQTALTGVGGISGVDVNLEGKQVTVEGDLPADSIIELIDEAGYDASELSATDA